MKYRSKPAEIEAMRWEKDGNMWRDERQLAGDIVHWVEAHGGEARYEPEHYPTSRKVFPQGLNGTIPARIAVRTINGWAYAAPGHYVIRGQARFPAPDAVNVITRELVDFYPCDPETFDKRWEPVS